MKNIETNYLVNTQSLNKVKMKINPKDLIEAVSQINSGFKQEEKFPLPLLAVRAKKAALENQSDQSLRLIANVFTKMSENGKIFITRGELKNICSKFNGSNNNVIKCFAEELDLPEAPKDRQIAGQASEEIKDLYIEADQTIANALLGMWDATGKPQKVGEYKLYDPNKAKQAQTITNLELTRMGIGPKSVNTFSGTDSFIFCDATYETPKGEAHLLIPVELSKSGALIPTFFVSKHGFADLNKNTIEEHILTSAGKNFNVNSNALLNALSVMKDASVMDDFEIKALAIQEAVNNKKMVKEASSRDERQMPFASNGILMQEVDKEESIMVALPQSKDFEKFASSLNSSKGVAEFVFGELVVRSAKDAISSKITSFGYKPQISVLACDDADNTITYAVKIDTGNGPVGFEAMAEINNGKAVLPSMLVAADKAYDFSKEGINSIIRSNETDYKSVAAVSPMYELKSSEILENIRTAADVGDFKTAEEALTVLAEKSDKETYSLGLAEYIRSVNASSNKQLQKKASVKSCCKRIVKSSTHSAPICGHLNMPLDKVYQNEQGECVPLYRKGMDNTYEGVLFNTSKIFG